MKLAIYLEERMDFGLINHLSGTPIIIVPTRKIQNRTHKKKRINKKWAKRYGFTLYKSIIGDNDAFVLDNKLYMDYKAYEKLKESVNET